MTTRQMALWLGRYLDGLYMNRQDAPVELEHILEYLSTQANDG